MITDRDLQVRQTEQWRERALYAEQELRRVEVETTLAAIERQEQLAKDEAARKAAERSAALEASLENQRVESWFNHRLEQAIAGGDVEFGKFLYGDLERHRKNVPPGWAPGAAPSLPAAEVVFEQDDDEKHVSQTALWKAVTRHDKTPPGTRPKGE